MEDPVSRQGSALPSAVLPAPADLDDLPADACRAELAPLFGRAPAFLARLVAARPFETDDGLIGAAYALARELPESEVIELVNARPHDPAEASRPDRDEPPDDDEETDPVDDAWVDEELGALAEVYRDRFGFDYAVFDAGRPRAEIIPLLEASLRNDRDAELRRAAAECVALAEYRLRALRGTSPGHVDDEESAEG